MTRQPEKKKRDFVREILERRDRAVLGSDRFSEVWIRLNAILEGLELLLSIRDDNENEGYSELLRHVPIALTACLEGYTKRALQDLIDSNERYRKNIRNLQQVSFDLDSVLAIEGRKVSIGEFVSHLINLSSLEDLDNHLSAIMGANFLQVVRAAKFSVFVGDEEKALPESVFGTISQMIAMRHVFCHEIARAPLMDNGVAYLQTADCVSFLYAAEKVVGAAIGRESASFTEARRG